jgi:uncharacterized membrane protein YbaN (DUF454 family)
MKRRILSLLKIFLGIVLLLVGVVGNFLPIIPGLLFMAAGLLLLAGEIPWVHEWLAKLEIRYPRVKSALRTIRTRDGNLNFHKIAVILIVLSLISAAVSYFVLSRV